MDIVTQVLSGVFAVGPVAAMIGASILGVFIGALPGLNPVMAIALLLPLTYSMEPLVALGMVAGIYNGSMYGGAIPAILLRIPGTPAAIATTFDGYPMAQRGEASRALKIACWSSALGGTASAIALMTIGPIFGGRGLEFGGGNVANSVMYLLFVLAIITVITAMILVLRGALATLSASDGDE